MDTIVVGVDDSTGARTALDWAARQAARTGSRLRVVHVYEVNVAWIDGYNPDLALWERHARETAEATAARVAEDVLGNFDADSVDVQAIEGDPAQVLHDEAHDAALVVVGSRGRGGFRGLLLGSVSQRLAQRAPCPVVIVPSPGDDVPAGQAAL
ncbi:MAG: universal stress protein [Acidimicrobiia bacterium]